MKKTALILLTTICILILTGCGCEHEWEEATCTSPKTCIHCHEKEGEPIDHQWKDATCTSPKTCDHCQETDGEPLDHQWQDATRTQPKICSRCNSETGQILSLQEAYPMGQTRFSDGKLHMNTEDFISLYLEDLGRNGYNFEISEKQQDTSNGYTRYLLTNDNNQYISLVVVEDVDSGLVCMVSAGCEYILEDIEATNDLLDAVSIVYETCHGAMTDKKWEEMMQTQQSSYLNNSLVYRYIYDGLGQLVVTSIDHFEVVVTPDMTLSVMQ